ncbi:MAG: cytochrome b/b6 domain-containing protein [Bradyrhizobiaceae bacterium]|nr:cytochrome b/b6 domain-containing protein [Bradyrhizobiaceae bacterium]
MSATADTENLHGHDAAGGLPRYAMRHYRLPAKVFHWVTATLVLFMIASGIAMTSLGSGPVADLLFRMHKMVGVLTFAVVLLRIAYRLAMPDPLSWRGQYRRPVLHWMLYLALILMPLLGWAGASDFGSLDILFGWKLPAIWLQGAGYADLLLELHAYVAFGMLALVSLHIGLAMQDHLTRARNADEGE